MAYLISKAGMAAILAAGTLVGSFSLAQAQDVQLRLGPGGVRVEDPRDRDYRDRGFRDRGGCSTREALSAARDEGFRRPEVVRVTDRSVTVRGWTSNGPDRITFANRRGCPAM